MQQIIRKVPYWGVIALLVYMPFHIFLAQSVSLVTGGLEVWKAAKDVVVFVLFLFTLYAVWRRGNVPRWYWWLVGGTTAYALLHILVWLAHPDLYIQSAILGTTYNVRLACFLVIGSGTALLYPRMFVFSSILKIILAVSTVVAVLGIVQYVLPKDILSHVGYSIDRGVRPNFFIDDNPAFPRIMSTLRDPNSLGAYLLLPITVLVAQLTRARRRRAVVLAAILIIHLLALYLTFSRSAWLAMVVSLSAVVWMMYSSYLVRIIRRWWPVIVLGVFVVAGLLFWQRHNTVIDGTLTHSTAAQVGSYDSNQLHWMYVTQGVIAIWHQPFGYGPGTAGLASIQNPDGGRLTENYYVQVGYEVGVIGLGLFVAGNIWVYYRITRRHDAWKTVLASTFWGYVLMNMLLHTWSNEAVAAQWWLAAGVALAVPTASHGRTEQA